MLSAGDTELLTERRLRGAELALSGARGELEQAHRVAAELTERIRGLEAQLLAARAEPDRLRSELASTERLRRAAEQRAYSERALREQLQDQLATIEPEPAEAVDAFERLADARARIDELEDELRELHREADELDHLAAAATSARRRAERQAAAIGDRLRELEALRSDVPSRSTRSPVVPILIAAELRLAARCRQPPATPRRPARTPAGPLLRRQLSRERALIGQRAHAEVAAATPPSENSEIGFSPAWRATLTQLREELRTLTTIAERDRAARVDADRRERELGAELANERERNAQAFESIDTLRVGLRQVVPLTRPIPSSPGAGSTGPSRVAGESPPGAASPPAAQAAGDVSPEALTAALSRLREATPPSIGSAPAQDAQAAPVRSALGATQPWLPAAFRRLARYDPAAAGRLLVALLPAHQLTHSGPLAYDLAISSTECICVTIDHSGQQVVEHTTETRRIDRISFRIVGDLERLGRLIGSGPVARRVGLRRARLVGDRGGLGVIDQLLSAPLRLGDLRVLGIELPPALTLQVVAAMIEPDWTEEVGLVLAHREPGAGEETTYLTISNRGRPRVGPPVPGAVPACTLVCDRATLPALFDGAAELSGELEGESTPFTQIRRWVKRAQSG